MMAKTFENVADASAINFQLLVAQMTINYQEQQLASPPFNLLMLPYVLSLSGKRQGMFSADRKLWKGALTQQKKPRKGKWGAIDLKRLAFKLINYPW